MKCMNGKGLTLFISSMFASNGLLLSLLTGNNGWHTLTSIGVVGLCVVSFAEIIFNWDGDI